MIRPRQVLRLAHIQWVLVRHGLEAVLLAVPFFRPMRFLVFLSPWYWLRNRHIPIGVRIRLALEDLGPIFVKFGQLLSTRRDLLPEHIADELARLQDHVPPFPSAQARAIVERELGESVSDLFEHFETEAFASASIAQVHGARLRDGREVVVKVVRPGIAGVIHRDVSLLKYVAGVVERYWSDARRLRPRQVVEEFEKTILGELDLRHEAANASQLRRNFQDSPLLYVPQIEWRYTRRDVMVMERIAGVPISDIEGLKRRGVDLRQLAEMGVEIFFTQVFRDSFFHADMHPGNIFVDVSDPDRPRYIAVDFGIMGSLGPTDQRYLAENFMAFFNRDYRRAAQLHLESGWVPPDTRVEEFEAALRTVCEPIFERPLREISFARLLVQLFQTARRFHMEVQPQLVLLQKTLINVEGLGRDLYPDLDLWQTAKPALERWMSEQVGVRGLVRELRTNLPLWAERLPSLPPLVHRAVEQAAHGQLKLEWRTPELDRLRQELAQGRRRRFRTTIGATLVIAAALLLGLDGGVQAWREAHPMVWLLAGGGALLLAAGRPRGRG